MKLYTPDLLDQTNTLLSELNPITVRKIDFKNPYFTQPKTMVGKLDTTEAMEAILGSKIEHLYVHVPFCLTRCFYCNYPKTTGQHSGDEQSQLLQHLSKEMARVKASYDFSQLKTIHIGGGTPNVLTKDNLEALLQLINRDFSADTEFAVELYPASDILSEDHLAMMRDNGVNRVSLGVQTFDDHINQVNGRIHQTRADAELFTRLSKQYFDNVSIDMLYGQKEQTLEGFQQDLAIVHGLDANSIYLYQTRELIKKRSTELQQALNYFLSFFKERGYDVVSFDQVIKSRKDFNGFCHHRSGRSKNENLVGIGPGAVSEIENVIYKNLAPELYGEETVDTQSIVVKSPDTIKREFFNRSLRHFNHHDVDGLKITDYQSLFESDIQQELSSPIELLQQNNLITVDSDKIQITDYGMLFTQQINYLLLDHYK